MSWRVLGIVALGAAIGVAFSMRSCSPQSVPDRESSSEVQREAGPDGGRGAIPNEAVSRAALENLGAPAPQPLPADADTSVSGLERFVEVRGIPRAPFVDDALKEFASQPRDPAWSTGMEARFQSELSRSSLTLTERYVECRRSVCVVALVRPPGTHEQEQEIALHRAVFAEMSTVAQTLDLFGIWGSAAVARDGSVVHWHRFQRKCGADWKCLE